MSKTIFTSSADWLAQMAKHYKNGTPFTLKDDKQYGVNPQKESLIDMWRKSDLPLSSIIGASIAAGISVYGAYMIRAALLDPEPTSKLALLLLAGTAVMLFGGMTAVKILTDINPPKVKLTKSGFEVGF